MTLLSTQHNIKDGYVKYVPNMESLEKNGALNMFNCGGIQQEPLKHTRFQKVTKNHYKSKLMSHKCWRKETFTNKL